MSQVAVKDKPVNKLIRIMFNITYIVLIVGAVEFFFNNNHSDDHYGTKSLLAFWVLRSLHVMLLSLWEGDKKYAIFNLLTVMVALASLIYIAFFN